MKHINLEFTESLDKAIKHLRKQGAFLTAKIDDRVNTMTIGWGSVGIAWGKSIFTLFVRESRYTHEFVEKSGEFTISIPVNDDLKKALAFCGVKSGRDYDKIKECHLKLVPGEVISTPVIQGCGIYFECKTLYKQQMKADFLDKKINSQSYADGDYHTIYYAEIVNCYTLDK
ncbi:flavin reductase family protein [Clostridium tyrobutyricum]|uniref:flavin reductase family protein n=1 Tax=Clostridium tyrobutyricum TaxID=1519 RepID=UPI0030CD096D